MEMTHSVDNPREVVKRAGGKPVKVKKVLDDPELGKVDLRDEPGHVLHGQGYTDDKGVEREFVQLKHGGLVALPKNALDVKGRFRSRSFSSIPSRVWNRIFGKKKTD